MRISFKKFIIIFLVCGFVFLGVTNLLLGPVVNGTWFPGMDSPIGWKRTVAHIIYPVKIVLVGPLTPVFNDPDPAPPIRVLACGIYWSLIATVLYFICYILRKIWVRKKV